MSPDCVSLTAIFPHKTILKRTPPFSIRLSVEERTRLEVEAQGVPLGAYIKAKALGAPPPKRMVGVEDRKALARALALLGQSRLANNLNQLAHAANIGALPVSPEMEAELRATLEAVRDLRRVLMEALGLKVADAP